VLSEEGTVSRLTGFDANHQPSASLQNDREAVSFSFDAAVTLFPTPAEGEKLLNV